MPTGPIPTRPMRPSPMPTRPPMRPTPMTASPRLPASGRPLPRAGRTSCRGPAAGRRRLARAAALALGGLLVGVGASGYRFVPAYDDGSRIAGADGAARWSAEYWPAGAALEWFLADDPGWTDSWVDGEGATQPPPFGSHSAALPSVREAMAAWSRIPTADIRLRLTGVASGPGVEQDDRNGITVTTNEEGFAGRANWWFQRRHRFGPWELFECDIELIPAVAARLASDDPRSLTTTIHEFGHCLGLAHSGRHPTIVHAFRDIGIWGETPKMSYGLDISNALALDDIVAASLLRPAGGWERRTGAITGRVAASGSPARFAAVGSVRLLPGGQTAPGPGVFTDEDGRFRLEGLVPGDYLIRAGPMTRVDAHQSLLEAGALLAALNGARLSPVTVRAGDETSGVSLELPPDRRGSDFIR